MTSKRRESDTIYKETGDTYYRIIDFENTTEKKCREFDKKNNELYIKRLSIFNKQNKRLSKYSMQIDNEPNPPPEPSNYQKLLIWRKRTIKVNVEEQSIAILFLIANGYKIRIPGVCDDGIEPFNAIKIANIISEKNGIDMKRTIEIYQNKFKLINYYDEYDSDECELDLDDIGNEFGFNIKESNDYNELNRINNKLKIQQHTQQHTQQYRNSISNKQKLYNSNFINKDNLERDNYKKVDLNSKVETDASTSTNNSISPQTNINIGTELAKSLMGIKPAGHSQQYQPKRNMTNSHNFQYHHHPNINMQPNIIPQRNTSLDIYDNIYPKISDENILASAPIENNYLPPKYNNE